MDERGGRPTVRGAVLCRTGGGRTARIRVPARVTIAADGRRSALAFALGLASHPPAPRRWAVGAYFEGIAGLDTVGEMHVRGPHYIGVAPIGDAGLANVCLVTPARDGLRGSRPGSSSGTSPRIPCSARVPRARAGSPHRRSSARSPSTPARPACPACSSPATPPASSIR